MSEQIDHEAAKDYATLCIETTACATKQTANLAHAYLARDKQVRELAELVKRSYNDGFSAGLDDYRKSNGGTIWCDSKAKQQLARILGAEESTHED